MLGLIRMSSSMASPISRIRIISSTKILARVQILDLICRMVLNFRANFDVHFMEQKFVNVASIFILKKHSLKGAMCMIS